MTGGVLPYPNGLATRVTELERRVGKIEDHETPKEVAIIYEQVKTLRNDIHELKRAAQTACGLLIAALGVLIPILIR